MFILMFSHGSACEVVTADARSCACVRACVRACLAIVCDDEQNRKIYKLNRYDCMKLVAVYFLYIRETSSA